MKRAKSEKFKSKMSEKTNLINKHLHNRKPDFQKVSFI